MIDRSEWVSRYEAGESSVAIARTAGLDPTTIRRALRRRGVPMRGRGYHACLPVPSLIECYALAYPDEARRNWIRNRFAAWQAAREE